MTGLIHTGRVLIPPLSTFRPAAMESRIRKCPLKWCVSNGRYGWVSCIARTVRVRSGPGALFVLSLLHSVFNNEPLSADANAS